MYTITIFFLDGTNTTLHEFDNKFVLILKKFTLPFGTHTLRVEAKDFVNNTESNRTEVQVNILNFG